MDLHNLTKKRFFAHLTCGAVMVWALCALSRAHQTVTVNLAQLVELFALSWNVCALSYFVQAGAKRLVRKR